MMDEHPDGPSDDTPDRGQAAGVNGALPAPIGRGVDAVNDLRAGRFPRPD